MAFTPRDESERPEGKAEGMTPEETKEHLTRDDVPSGDEIEREVAEEHGIDPASVMDPLFWYCLVLPKQPKKYSEGGILLTDDTKEAQEHLVFCGQVLKVGDLAFQAKTRAGLDLSEDSHRPKVGDWVVFAQYAGQRMELRDETVVLMLADTEMMGRTDHPELFRHYI